MAIDWTTFAKWLAALDWTYNEMQRLTAEAFTANEAAWTAFGGGDDHTAINQMLVAQYKILEVLNVHIWGSHTYKEQLLFPYGFNNYVKAVTWQSIVEAWVKDDFAGRDWTIAVIDRMRQILWDEPFSIIWAARPEEKEIEP